MPHAAILTQPTTYLCVLWFGGLIKLAGQEIMAKPGARKRRVFIHVYYREGPL
jgi:hypothetical protein